MFTGQGLAQRLLNLPIFFKILIGNSLVVIVGAVFGTWITQGVNTAVIETLMAFFVVAGITLTIAVNWIILSAALQPLVALREVVERVYRGDLGARAKPPLIGDPTMNQLGAALNLTLDRLQISQRRLEELSRKALAAQEEERKRISRELHDEAGQMLTSLTIGLKTLEGLQDLEQVRERAAELRALSSSTLDALHRLAVELRPSALDELGLVSALRNLVREYKSRLGIPIEFRAAGPRERLPAEVEIALYRVVQEALTNVAKHARAATAAVSLEARDGMVVAEVVDNGQGFLPEEVMNTREEGLGLFGMEERVGLVHGSLAITSALGEGTRVRAEVPLPPGRADHG